LSGKHLFYDFIYLSLMIGIYKITNPKGKIYIGQSTQIEKRFNQYKTLDKTCIGSKLFNSLIKYGPYNHIFEIIEECNLEELDYKEFIYKQNVLKENNWEQVLFLQLKDKQGGKRSQLTKEKIKKSKMGKNSKKIFQYSLEGNFIKEWNSIVDAERIYGTGIKENLSKKTLTSHNFIWSYENNLVYSPDKIKNKWKSNTTSVLQYSLEGNFIKEWGSIIEIEKTLGFKNSNISSTCKGKQKTAYGYKWKYK
jgi:group I intron endonuclease